MAIFCNVSYPVANEYRGKSLTTEFENKKHPLFFKLVCDDFTLEDALNLAKVSKNILMLDYRGTASSVVYQTMCKDSGVYVGRLVEFGTDVTEKDIVNLLESEVPDGVTLIVRVPAEYNDLQFVHYICSKYNNVRFAGGQLFAINGVRLGAIGVDILAGSNIKFSAECYTMCDNIDVIKEVEYGTLEITASVKSNSGSNKSASSKSSGRSNKGSSKTLRFASIFENARANN